MTAVYSYLLMRTPMRSHLFFTLYCATPACFRCPPFLFSLRSSFWSPSCLDELQQYVYAKW